ncbi:dimethyladenosine transferase 1, mitochondrial-like [Tubulanus polymorphus]|uniref:dimethyladenosine transferase 1, mitochondrial-like n=1 Tax=Tubulanus polymorphus TaxID=672921 RepID=UPI003DA49B66
MRLPPLPTIKDIIRVYKLRARKQLSQNFILNERINKKIVKAAGDISGHHVCEVGPGPGGITRAILQAGAKHVCVIEKDPRFQPSLELLKEACPVPLDINIGDVLRFNMVDLFPKELSKPWHDESPDIHIIGNLPFSVSTPLIIKWLEAIAAQTGAWSYGRTKLTLTFQKEVTERMVAGPNNIQRSRLSIMCQNYCKVYRKFVLAGSVFVPPPDVDVGVVHFVPRVEPQIKVPFKILEKVVRLVFQHRNKTFKNACELFFPPNRPELMEELVMKCKIPLEARSRELTMDDFNRLCSVYEDICGHDTELLDYNFRSKSDIESWRNRKKIWRDFYEKSENSSTDSNSEIEELFEKYISDMKKAQPKSRPEGFKEKTR